jgi:hypothetical protein
MEEIYRIIEEKIKAAGYTHEINGREIYDEICDEIEGKENGAYICMVKKEDNIHFEYHVEIMDNEFNLAGINIVEGDKMTYVDFDS